MGSLDEKPPPPTKQSVAKGVDEEARPQSPVALGTTDEVHDLTVLGYKPELQRNRSMFTLLFQSLAIAAVRTLAYICTHILTYMFILGISNNLPRFTIHIFTCSLLASGLGMVLI